jgi:hypothetical protein
MKLGLSSLLAFLLASSPLLAAAAQPDPPAGPDSAPADVAAPAPAPAPAAPATAPAPVLSQLVPDGAAAETATARPHGPPHYDYLRFGLGARVGYIGNSGYDTFSKNDVLTQASLDVTYAFYTRGRLALSGGLAWDVGSSSAGARGLTTRLTAHRLTVPLEARWYLAPWVNVFAKIAPGAAAFNARVEDPSSPETLEQAPWVFAADFSGGASFRIVGTSDHAQRHPRLWLTQEVGYGVTSSTGLRPGPNRDEEDVLGSDQSARLNALALNGVFWRTGLALSF